jgi:predicted ribonuclease YlaK
VRIISWFVLGFQVCSVASAVDREPGPVPIFDRQACPGLMTREVTTYVLDTNILLTKPSAFLDYAEGQQVAITEQTLRELESKKTDLRLGVSAREFFREFKKATGEGSLAGPITLPNGSTLSILTLDEVTSESPHALRKLDLSPTGNPDNKILGAMLQYRAQNPEQNVVFVSNDEAFRVLARVNDFPVGRIEETTRSVVIVSDEDFC